MGILVWVTQGTWPAAVDAAADLLDQPGRAGAPEDVVLLCVVDGATDGVTHGAFGGLLGRGHRRDPGPLVGALAQDVAEGLLAAAAERLGRPARTELRRGRAEREVVRAVAELGVDTLVLSRDGDLDRLGPHSLGHQTRFVLDHAPCRVVLVWPQAAPGISTIPPPAARPPHPPAPPRP